MSRKPSLKPSTASREELLERRVSDLERMLRRLPVRSVSSGADQTATMVQQTTHGLAVGSVIRHNGTSWTNSQADTAANAVVGGIVISVLSPDVFVMATAGYVAGLSGLTAGSVHYLSAATAGAVTTTAPFIAVPIILADSAASGVLAALCSDTGPGDGAACTVLGRSANSTGVRADIAAAADNQVLRRIGGELQFATVVGWGDIQFTSPTHPLPDGYLASPTTLDADGYGSTLGFYADAGSGMDISVVRNTRGDLPGVHNPDDLEISIKLQNGTAANQAMIWNGGSWAPTTLSSAVLSDSGVTAGNYGPAWRATVDAKGVITSATAQAVGNTYNADQTVKAEGQNFLASVSGTYWQTTINWQTGAPVFNAKWLRGTEMNATAPTEKYQVIKYDPVNSNWSPWKMAGEYPRTGDILYVDTAADPGYALAQAGLARSVLGRSAATDGAPAPIEATADNFVLGRRGGVLTWAKVARAELADGGACSVIGRSANSSGVTADISASADGQVLTRISGVLQFAAAGSGLPAITATDEGKTLWANASGEWTATRDVVLGKGALSASSTQGLLGVVTSSDGDYIKISASGVQLFDRSISSTTALITINTGHASLTSTARALSLREIDVCDAGVAKKMLVLASAPY
jgi:hypothetical protein